MQKIQYPFFPSQSVKQLSGSLHYKVNISVLLFYEIFQLCTWWLNGFKSPILGLTHERHFSLDIHLRVHVVKVVSMK